MAVDPVGAAASTSATTSATSADTALQDAFSQAILKFGIIEMQSMMSDVQEACSDTTSNPDAPS